MHAAQCLLGQGVAGVGKAGDAEVGHLHAAVPQHHNVLGLDVPVDNAPAVGVGEAVGNLQDEVQRLPPVHLTPALHILFQRDAVNQLHHNVFNALKGGHVVHGDDIGMAELGHRQGLVPEPAAELGVFRQVAFQRLHRHQAVQPQILSLIYIGHAAGADELQKLIPVIQQLPDIGFHCLSSPFLSFAAAPR